MPIRFTWQSVAAVAATVGVMFTAAGYVVGRQVKIADAVVQAERFKKHVDEAGPLVQEFREVQVQAAVNGQRLNSLENAVGSLIAAQRDTNMKIDRLIDVMMSRSGRPSLQN
jgi:hypothetical protein